MDTEMCCLTEFWTKYKCLKVKDGTKLFHLLNCTSSFLFLVVYCINPFLSENFFLKLYTNCSEWEESTEHINFS